MKGKDGTAVRVPPERSTCVFVEELWGQAPAGTDERINALDRVLQELEALRKERSR